MVDPFFAPARFSYAHNFYQDEIEAFLTSYPGPLNDVTFQIGDRSQSFAAVVVNLSNLYSINPKILLTLLEQQSGLLTTAEPSVEQLQWAMGLENANGHNSGLYRQLRRAALELRFALRDYALGWQQGSLPPLTFADNSKQEVPPDITLARYAMARVLALSTTPDQLPGKLHTFRTTYTALFEDPRYAPDDWPPLAEPFLTRPMEQPFRVTSFFDHNTPLLHENGSVDSFWGTREALLSYDGHTGWDYAMRPPDDVVLAAAPGTVVFAGNSNDGCGVPARGVIIDHGNGYRTLYWHLDSMTVSAGESVQAGARIGVAGATGCAFGPHLHFQVQYLGRDVDPYGWCSTQESPWASNPAGQQSVWLWRDMPNPCGEPPPGSIVVDNASPDLLTSGEWERSSLGYGGSALFTATSQVSSEREPWQMRRLVDTPAVAVWQPDLPRAGSYRVLAYIPYILNGLDDSEELRYQVRHHEGMTEVVIDGESTANFWADLGTYHFDPQHHPRVTVSTLAGDEARGLWADALIWVPVEQGVEALQ